jgi:hypothetical protein
MAEWTGSSAGWQLVVDSDRNTVYYYNSETGESSWEPPDGFAEAGGSDATAAARSRTPKMRASWTDVPDVQPEMLAAGKPPKPTAFVVIKSAMAAKKAFLRRKQKAIEWIQVRCPRRFHSLR